MRRNLTDLSNVWPWRACGVTSHSAHCVRADPELSPLGAHWYNPQVIVLGAHNLVNYRIERESRAKGAEVSFAAHSEGALPPHTILYNFEPIAGHGHRNEVDLNGSSLVQLYRPFTVWEYSRHNFEKLKVRFDHFRYLSSLGPFSLCCRECGTCHSVTTRGRILPPILLLTVLRNLDAISIYFSTALSGR
jgi:hypothetical protein